MHIIAVITTFPSASRAVQCMPGFSVSESTIATYRHHMFAFAGPPPGAGGFGSKGGGATWRNRAAP